MGEGGRERNRRALLRSSLLDLAALLLGAPLLFFGRVLAGHDTRTYLMYAGAFADNARAGILLPAWAFELNGGYGGPGLLFYPPLVHAADALALLAGLRASTAVAAVALAALLLSGAAFLAWRRAEGDAETAALLGALVYMAAPYRMADLYERAALSEHAAFAFPPLVLLALGARAPARRRIAGAALALGGLALTNLPMLVLLGAALVAERTVRGARALAELALAGLLAAALAAFALVPAALAGRWTVTELFYGGSAGAFRPSANALFSSAALLPEFNLRVSLVVLATAALAAFAFALAKEGRESWLWGGVSVACLVGTLPVAGALWDAAPLASKLQFPWRLAAPATLALAALVSRARGPRRAAALLAAAGLAAAPFVGSMTVPRSLLARAGETPPRAAFPAPASVEEAEGFAPAPWLENHELADVWYLPRTLGAPLAAEIYQGGPAAVPGLAEAAAVSPDVPGTIRASAWTAAARALSVSAPAPSTLLLHLMAFPGLDVRVDGAPARAGRDRRTGLVAVSVPAGTHEVSWRWRPFGALRGARAVSAAALLLAVLLAAAPAAPRR